jgi:ferrochelatase
MAKTGVLLVNLGTPEAPKKQEVGEYLTEFLTDKRVIDIPWLPRQMLVRRVIVPKRAEESAKNYLAIWTKEGSPLLVHGKQVEKALQKALGEDYSVRLAMRYQSPSIGLALAHFQLESLERLIVLPLFPQYASATTGSVHEKVLSNVQNWQLIPHLDLINSYATDPGLIEAFKVAAKDKDLSSYDHILFSFHGLPEKQLKKVDRGNHCTLSDNCCHTLTENNHFCYGAQCYATGQALAQKLGLTKERYTICFQSRFGKDPWKQPYLSDVLKECVARGDKKILVFCPSFVCDCVETIHEIGVEYAELFHALGGDRLDLVKGLNNHPVWIEALANLVKKRMPQHAGV